MSTMQIRGFWLFPIVLESTVRPHAPQLKQGLTLTVMMVKGIDFGRSKMFKSKTIKYEYNGDTRPFTIEMIHQKYLCLFTSITIKDNIY